MRVGIDRHFMGIAGLRPSSSISMTWRERPLAVVPR
jgi:hypothetical protein